MAVYAVLPVTVFVLGGGGGGGGGVNGFIEISMGIFFVVQISESR